MNGSILSVIDAEQAPLTKQELELIKRAKELLFRDSRERGIYFSTPDALKDFLTLEISMNESEGFYGLFLDTQHRLIEFSRLFNGTIDGCSVYPREVVKEALRVNAAAVIFAHNHPSGVAEPSPADKKITGRLKEALDLVGVRVLDHMILGHDHCVSFAERCMI
ncbi:RadC family protein [Porticoccus sp. GXU_MW_L64]